MAEERKEKKKEENKGKEEKYLFAEKKINEERSGGKYLEKEKLSRVDGRKSRVL